MTIQQLLFIVIALVVLVSAVMVVTTRNLFHAALFLILSFFGVAAFYALLEAGFFAAMQVLVYIGAISILFIFAVMLTRDVITAQRVNSQWVASAVMAGVLFIGMLLVLGPWEITIRGRVFGWCAVVDCQSAADIKPVPATYIPDFGRALVSLNQYAVPFLLGSVMILMAMVGAIWVAREVRETETPAEIAETADDDSEPAQPVQEPIPFPESAAPADQHPH